MSTTIFDVTPEELESSANKIEQKISEFTKTYNSIYTAVNDLQLTYKGEASDTFNKRIEGHKNDFSSAEKALTNYIQFLREYAANMKRTEDELKNKANSLRIGN